MLSKNSSNAQHLINYGIGRSPLKQAWKQSFVLPVAKVALPESMSELKAISILPTLSKIFERMLDNQISEDVGNCNLLPCFQSPFCRDHICATALTKVSDNILEVSDCSDLIGLVSIGLLV